MHAGYTSLMTSSAGHLYGFPIVWQFASLITDWNRMCNGCTPCCIKPILNSTHDNDVCKDRFRV